MTSPGRLWCTLRRDLRRGFAGSKHFYRTLPKIEQWKWPFWGEKTEETPVHVLTGADDWRLAAWMLASWFYFSEHSWPLTIHDDGTLPGEARAAFEAMFPKPRIISRAESDAEMEKTLKQYPFCYEYRGMHPLALKIFDAAHFAGGGRFLLFDSDLLFFNYPGEILDWLQGKTEGCWFAADAEEHSIITSLESQDEFGIKLWSKVSTGLGLIEKETVDLDFCDRALAQTTILRGKLAHVEQTLYTLCASRAAKGGLLSAKYEVSRARHARPETVARHYTGASRDCFYSEGLPRLENVLLHDED